MGRGSEGDSSAVSSNFSEAAASAGAGKDGGSPERWRRRGWISTDYPRGPRAPRLDTMAQQSVTRVTGRRCGCHHKTFQLVIANINVAAAHARCRADSHARTTRRAFSFFLSFSLTLFVSLFLFLSHSRSARERACLRHALCCFH